MVEWLVCGWSVSCSVDWSIDQTVGRSVGWWLVSWWLVDDWQKVKVEVKAEVEAKTEMEEGEGEERGGDRGGGERRQLVGCSAGWWLVGQRWKRRGRGRRAKSGGQGQG